MALEATIWIKLMISRTINLTTKARKTTKPMVHPEVQVLNLMTMNSWLAHLDKLVLSQKTVITQVEDLLSIHQGLVSMSHP